MLVPFESLPDHARLWVYKSDRAFTPEEKSLVEAKLKAFCEQWEAHKKPLQSGFSIVDDYFILLAVNEDNQEATGCSIDSSVGVIKDINAALQVDLFDRLKMPIKLNGNIALVQLSELKKKLVNGEYPENLRIINTTAQTLKDYRTAWEIPVEDSWLGRFVPVN